MNKIDKPLVKLFQKKKKKRHKLLLLLLFLRHKLLIAQREAGHQDPTDTKSISN